MKKKKEKGAVPQPTDDYFAAKQAQLIKERNLRIKIEQEIWKEEVRSRHVLCVAAQRNINTLAKSRAFNQWLAGKGKWIQLFRFYESSRDDCGGDLVELFLREKGGLILNVSYESQVPLTNNENFSGSSYWAWEKVKPIVERLAESPQSTADFLLGIAGP